VRRTSKFHPSTFQDSSFQPQHQNPKTQLKILCCTFRIATRRFFIPIARDRHFSFSFLQRFPVPSASRESLGLDFREKNFNPREKFQSDGDPPFHLLRKRVWTSERKISFRKENLNDPSQSRKRIGPARSFSFPKSKARSNVLRLIQENVFGPNEPVLNIYGKGRGGAGSSEHLSKEGRWHRKPQPSIGRRRRKAR